jgi:hypothetical protein
MGACLSKLRSKTNGHASGDATNKPHRLLEDDIEEAKWSCKARQQSGAWTIKKTRLLVDSI